MVYMDVVDIAMAKAEILHRLSNWGYYSTISDGSRTINDSPRSWNNGGSRRDKEELQLIKLDAKIHKLARLRADATGGGDFYKILPQVKLEVMFHLARILSENPDPAPAGLMDVVIGEGGQVCGICREELNVGERGRAMECQHKFHSCCIMEWLQLQEKKTCPLCRHEVQIKELDF
ncbi:hypothetical protein Tsubulata_013893 [Turnera subulata]|uniref:RING-type E3 ubiquitin transferase n=1 Tax=Turnera subulata TaxID=218843 RepID=A0A9Q0FAF1_9ROSI|nr:hypothetical protein Tsubulata_013893 [Turnera subulata]